MDERSVLLVLSDHPSWAGLREAITEISGLRLIGEAGTGEAALQLARSHQPDVIFLPAEVTDLPLAELVAELRQTSPASQIIVIGTRCECGHLLSLADLHVAAYLLWQDLQSREGLRRVLTTLLVDRLVLASPAAVARFLDEIRAGGGSRDPTTARTVMDRYGLSQREYEVWQLIAQGLSNQQIAEHLTLSTATVAKHVSHVLAKLDAASRHAAAEIFWQHHAIVPHPSPDARQKNP